MSDKSCVYCKEKPCETYTFMRQMYGALESEKGTLTLLIADNCKKYRAG